MEARLCIAGENGRTSSLTVKLNRERPHVTEMNMASGSESADTVAEFALGQILEARLSLAALGASSEAPVRFQFSLWQGGLPMDAVPQQGWIEMPTAEPAVWPA